MDEPVGIEAVAQPQRARLFHIDFRAGFLGSLSRLELMRRFGLAEAAATRDLTLYRSLAPDNLALDQRTKRWRRTPAFRPLFAHDPLHTLTALTDGLGDDTVGTVAPPLRAEHPLRLNYPAIEVIAAVSRAIAEGRALAVDYVSPATGPALREVVPFALVDTGARWHARAWDRRQARFLDLVLTRMRAAAVLDDPVAPHETREHDDQWMRMVELELVPHPGLAHPEAVEAEHAMADGVRRMRLRAALVGHALWYWGVDITPGAQLAPERHPLHLRNPGALYGVEGLARVSGNEAEDEGASPGRAGA